MEDIFVTADTHFDHGRLLELGVRDFESIKSMNSTIILNWNRTVKSTDTIYHLGDFGMVNRARCEALLNQLNGHKILIIGNHDKRQIYGAKGWADKKSYKRLRWNNYRFILCHYPILSWHGMHKGAIMLHGHSHGNLNKKITSMIEKPLIDVGSDCWNFTPVNLADIVKYTDNNYQQYLPVNGVDHHV